MIELSRSDRNAFSHGRIDDSRLSGAFGRMRWHKLSNSTSAANRNDAAAIKPVLLEMDPNLMNKPLNRDVAGSVLPQPGMNKPIGPAPDVRGIERLLFAETEKLAVISRRIMRLGLFSG